jgi:hypothetical protein
MMTLIGVRSYRLGVDPARFYDTQIIDRDALIFTPVIAESDKLDAATLLRPVMDEMWNAAGLSACGDYDQASGRPTRDLEQSVGRW